MKKKIIYIGFSVLLLHIISCEDHVEEPDFRECPDERFIGEWVCPNRVGYHDLMTYYFPNNNKLGRGSINLLRPNFGFLPWKPSEWKIENEKYYIRLWDVNASWEIFNLQFINENSIIIDGKTYYKTKSNFNWEEFLK
jgi:hypothetical protein